MGLLYLIQQNDAVRLASYPFAELSSFFKSYIARRSSDEPGDVELLHVFAHVQPYHVVL